MILKQDAGIFTVKLNIGDYFGAKPSDYYITLREPTMDEVLKIQGNKEEADRIAATFSKIQDMIIEHNFEKEVNGEAVKMNNKEVWSEIMKRSDCASVVSEKWTDSCPLFKRSRKKSEESQATPSKDLS